MAHLASYRDEIHAAAGWKTLQKAHRDLLINRSPVTVTAEGGEAADEKADKKQRKAKPAEEAADATTDVDAADSLAE